MAEPILPPHPRRYRKHGWNRKPSPLIVPAVDWFAARLVLGNVPEHARIFTHPAPRGERGYLPFARWHRAGGIALGIDAGNTRPHARKPNGYARIAGSTIGHAGGDHRAAWVYALATLPAGTVIEAEKLCALHIAVDVREFIGAQARPLHERLRRAEAQGRVRPARADGPGFVLVSKRLRVCCYDKLAELADRGADSDALTFARFAETPLELLAVRTEWTRVEFRVGSEALRAVGMHTAADVDDPDKRAALTAWITDPQRFTVRRVPPAERRRRHRRVEHDPDFELIARGLRRWASLACVRGRAVATLPTRPSQRGEEY